MCDRSSSSALWNHSRVLMTPHIASDVQIDGGVALIVENIRRARAGTPLLNVVDRGKGY